MNGTELFWLGISIGFAAGMAIALFVSFEIYGKIFRLKEREDKITQNVIAYLEKHKHEK